ncbi:ACP S-malonyltransferase [Marinicrinis sediminis]|uniref:[acyl-carrier-protein] S-malonyltransferase n=1 Tax=Marinicrinis sediminis TaxID=1652465 RepID=A0ABW5RDN4_9BACL
MAFVFPGQGSQYPGMAGKWMERSEAFREVLNEADDALGWSLSTLCTTGSQEELKQTERTQPALLTISMGIYRAMEEKAGRKLSPTVLAGHSLGEYGALVVAGAISFGEALRLTERRGQLMEEALPGGVGSMAAISGIDGQLAGTIIANWRERENKAVWPACWNGPTQTVVAGHTTDLEELATLFRSEPNVKVQMLRVSGPFHSPLMESVTEAFRSELKQAAWQSPSTPVLSNIHAQPYRAVEDIIDGLARQLTEPVRWVETMTAMKHHHIQEMVEIGPRKVLKQFAAANGWRNGVLAMDEEADWAQWHQAYEPMEPQHLLKRCIQLAVTTRNQHHTADHVKQIEEQYEALQKLQVSLDHTPAKSGDEAFRTTMEAARHHLSLLLQAKGCSDEEQSRLMRQMERMV